MTHLAITCLGPFQATLSGRLVADFKSNKVRALLAYLAVESDRPHHREALAGLLWPDWPDREALSNLRYALSNLRQVIGDRQAQPPFLLISRDTLQFNAASDYELDVAHFCQMAEVEQGKPEALACWQQAEALYRGDFLEGSLVSDSLAYEAWSQQVRERLAGLLAEVLRRLASSYEKQGQYPSAKRWARLLVGREPWNEAAHRQLLRILALSGQRGAALAHYETCCRQLAETLDVEPADETKQLYRQIREGRLVPPAARPSVVQPSAADLPAFLQEAGEVTVERLAVVGREAELDQLDRFLTRALAGQGRVIFVTGEAGSGKTALIQEFARRAQQEHDEVVAAGGNCNAYTGIGDPYLPFREILELLTGDVESRWEAGAIDQQHARRLWQRMPAAVQALVESGPELLDTFIARTGLLDRVKNGVLAGEAWLTRLNLLLEHKSVTGSGAPNPQQSDLFEQYTRVLQALSQKAPLLLYLDDLQWADPGSISLLFHLGRRLAGSRILILSAYRPEEVAIGRDGQRHPLNAVINEIQRDLGEIVVNLDQSQNRAFLEALLDQEPNQLDPTFRQMLYLQTGGHPLFTIELLRGLQERGDLVQDQQGRWQAGIALDWDTLPARVEAVFAERVGRLDHSLREALRVACVEGEQFTAEVVARVAAAPDTEILSRLSGELDRKHRLVRAQSIERVDGQLLSRYRFRHFLFQKYLYHSLDRVERVHLHERVGLAIEALHQASELRGGSAVSLARHFQEARISEKAVQYLSQAGARAIRLSAYEEAATHLSNGLELLMTMSDSEQRREQELDLQLQKSVALVVNMPGQAWQQAVSRARQLSHQLGKTAQLCQVVGQLAALHYVRAEYPEARRLAEEAVGLAEALADPLLLLLGHWHLGFILFTMGEYTTARSQLLQAIETYDPELHQAIVELRGVDAGLSAMAYDACCLWCLGFPEQALARSREVLEMARNLGHIFTQVDVLCFAGCLLHTMRLDWPALEGAAREMSNVSQGKDFPGWSGTSTCYQGEALVMQGQLQEGMALVHQGMATRRAQNAICHLSGAAITLAKAQAQAGRVDEALETLDQIQVHLEARLELHWAAELYRLQGELLLISGSEVAAEAKLNQAVDLAGRQEAKIWQLRAAVSLARHWQRQGQRDSARQLLQPIYEWFSEGFAEPDLEAAAKLLAELSGDEP